MIEIVTPIVAFGSGILLTILSIQIRQIFKTRSIKSAVRRALIDFANAWDAFLETQPPKVASFSSRSSVMDVLKKTTNVEAIINRMPVTLSNPHLIEAKEIADTIDSMINRRVNPAYASELDFSRDEIDALAKRAKQCASKLDGLLSKK
jgi:hypothetical protein